MVFLLSVLLLLIIIGVSLIHHVLTTDVTQLYSEGYTDEQMHRINKLYRLFNFYRIRKLHKKL